MRSHVLYYFPHSNKNYTDRFYDIKILSNETLNDHTFCLTNSRDRKILSEKIISEIKSNNTTYKEEIVEGNSQSRLLTQFFNKDFRAYMRPGYYVDALLDISSLDDYKTIIEKLQHFDIPVENLSFEERKYLVIRNINTKEISD